MKGTGQRGDDTQNVAVVQRQTHAARSIAQKKYPEKAYEDASDDDGRYSDPEQHQIQNRYDDKGQAGKKRGSGRDGIFDAHCAEDIHSRDKKREEKSLFQRPEIQIFEMLPEENGQNQRSDEKAQGKNIECRISFHNFCGRVADSPQKSGDKKTAGSQPFGVSVMVHVYSLIVFCRKYQYYNI